MREKDRLCVQGGPGSDTGVMETLAVDELVSMEWSEVQEEDSDSCTNMKARCYTQIYQSKPGCEQQSKLYQLV